MTRTVLILGARGRFGRHAAAAFDAAGWRVRALVRTGGAAPEIRDAVEGDASDPQALIRAAAGADVIVHAVNPPYPAWAREIPPVTEAVVAAARATGARVIIPGNVYNYGSGMPQVLDADAPRRPDTRKGRLREEMEGAFRRAADDGVRSVILRCGDFLDTRITGNWFDGHISAQIGKGRAVYPGALDHVHAWAFLPDAARAAVELAERSDELPAHLDIGFEGASLTGRELVAAMERAAGRRLEVRAMPWTALRLLAPFWPMGREILEMRYLWDTPHRIDGAALRALLPGFKATPPDEAIRAAMAPRLDPVPA